MTGDEDQMGETDSERKTCRMKAWLNSAQPLSVSDAPPADLGVGVARRFCAIVRQVVCGEDEPVPLALLCFCTQGEDESLGRPVLVSLDLDPATDLVIALGEALAAHEARQRHIRALEREIAGPPDKTDVGA